jgi:hypothetical protein
MAASGAGTGTVQSSTATCPAGTIVTGGGWETGARTFIAYAAKGANDYSVIAVNAAPITATIKALAICASPNAAPVAAAASRTTVARRLAQVRAA